MARDASCVVPEVADDRRVDEHVERFGGERPERRDGQAEDLAIVGRAAQHPRSLYDRPLGEAPPLPPPRRSAHRLPRGGDRPAPRAHPFRRALAPRVGAAGRGAGRPLPPRAARPARCTATPRTAPATPTRPSGSRRCWPASCATRAGRARASAGTTWARCCSCARCSTAGSCPAGSSSCPPPCTGAPPAAGWRAAPPGRPPCRASTGSSRTPRASRCARRSAWRSPRAATPRRATSSATPRWTSAATSTARGPGPRRRGAGRTTSPS